MGLKINMVCVCVLADYKQGYKHQFVYISVRSYNHICQVKDTR